VREVSAAEAGALAGCLHAIGCPGACSPSALEQGDEGGGISLSLRAVWLRLRPLKNTHNQVIVSNAECYVAPHYKSCKQ
jgi:hypothetical protein